VPPISNPNNKAKPNPMKSKSNPYLRPALFAAATLALGTAAHAGTFYWDPDGSGTSGFGTAGGTWGGDDFWNTDSTGGSGGTIANTTITTADDIFFGTAADGLGAGTLTGPSTAQGFLNMTFGSASGAIDLSGGTLNLDSATGSTITVNNASDTISTNLQGSGGNLIKAGTGTLTLTGASNFTGAITVNSGNLTLRNGQGHFSASGAVGNLTVDSGGTFDFSTDITDNYITLPTISLNGGAITGTDAGNYGANSYIGFYTSAINATGNSSMSGLYVTYLQSGSGTIPIDVSNGSTLTIGNVIRNAYATPNTTSLNKTSDGTLTLTGANTYTGTTTVSGGNLQIGDGGTSGTLGSGAVTIANGATLTINRSNTYGTPSNQNFSGAGTLVKEGAGDLIFNGGEDHTAAQGIENLIINGGLVRTDYFGALNSDLALTVNGSGILELWSANQSLGTLNGNGTVRNTKYFDRATTLTVAAGSFSGTITDSGITSGGAGTGDTRLSLVKSGAGTLALSGTISYGGNTTVEGGTLSIGNGGSPTNLSDSATVSIASGATMNLNFTGSDTVGVLEINGSGPLPADTYNSSHPTYGSYFSGGGSLVVPVTATDYEIWGMPYGLTAGSEGGDLDNDGLTNFEEYAFGLIPDSGASVNPIAAPLDQSTGTFSYTRRTDSGLAYSVWFSENLATWTEDTGASEGTPVPSGDNETVEVTLSVPPGDPLPAKLFIQVRAD
jgi:autotransporter-associated beta strand protein